jgi:hypothetical protein
MVGNPTYPTPFEGCFGGRSSDIIEVKIIAVTDPEPGCECEGSYIDDYCF